ncbi:MAG: SIMPL domain-containing protein [Rubrivivax sp.]|nr:SIMPL domain-containing protein [Rubrivivax sp.]
MCAHAFARWLARGMSAAAVLAAGVAGAQMLPPPQNVVSLSASADTELPNDWLTVVLGTRREGLDAAALQAELKQALDGALAEARPLARPGQVVLRTGGFSLSPRYDPRTSRNSGWVGQTQLVIEGRDTAAVAGLAGRIQMLSIFSASWSLSPQARQTVEGEVTAQAIQQFRNKADAVAKAFGFPAWTLREVNVGADGSRPYPAPRVSAMASRSAAAEAPLPTEAGQATVGVNVSGSIELSR